MEQVGFGIIGSGLWSELHARVINSTEGISLVGLADVYAGKAELLAPVFCTAPYEDYRALLNDESIKAVSIVTPSCTHAEIALAAVEAGKHVLVEAPLGMTEEDCQRVIDAAKASGAKLMVDFHNRWIPPIQDSKVSIESEEIGISEYIDLHSVNRIDIPTMKMHVTDQTTIAWFAGVHSADTLRWLTGSEVRRVYSVSRSRRLQKLGIDTPDFYQTILQFESGVTATVEDSWIFPRKAANIMEFDCKVAGSKGVLYVNNGYTTDIFSQKDGFAARSVQHFIDCVLNDKDPSATGEDGLEATKIVLAMEESVRTGSPVEICR